METYYRKRFKKDMHILPSVIENVAAEQGSITKMQSPFLARHCTDLQHKENAGEKSSEMQNNTIEVGRVYEIDHSHLPPKNPVQLRSIRVVMVSEKTEMNVVVRYPNMESLRAFFKYSTKETHPALNEKFVMGISTAEKVLHRLVTAESFSEKKGSEDFWVNKSSSSSSVNLLKCNGLVSWGVRRQVKYLGNDENLGDDGANEEKVKEEKNMEEEDEEEEEEEEEEDDEDEEEDEEEEEEKVKKGSKRKGYSFRNISNKKQKKGKPKFKEALILRNPKSRWAAERYKLAEKSLLEVMKEKGAVHEKPILRPQLRLEARKKIGDTGLLDHLLKHVAGKIAPGGEERFRRRHNPDGAMEYWLENAELVNVRKDAGVTDPYWVPPPGWKLGDSPSQDPICAREINLLKDDISSIKRDLELRATKKELEEEVGRLRREIDELSSKGKHEENQTMTITSSPSEISQKLDQLSTSLISSKIELEKAPVTLEKYKEQLLFISDFVKEIEDKIGMLTSTIEEKEREGSTLMILADKENKPETKDSKTKQQQVQSFIAAGEKCQITAAEQKAAKIQRLKSGFRICKPQGTFLWPNMVKNNNLVQVEVPTPPSVSSSTALAPPQLPFHHHNYHQPASPVKPLAERRAVTIMRMVSNHEDDPKNYSTMLPVMLPTTYGPRNVMGCDKKQNHASCYSSGSSITSDVGKWLALSTPKSASDESSHG